jgi:hypothetical protein
MCECDSGLVYSRDVQLLDTECWALELAGYRVLTVLNLKDAEQATSEVLYCSLWRMSQLQEWCTVVHAPLHLAAFEAWRNRELRLTLDSVMESFARHSG